MSATDELVKLYSHKSKHSNYQALPKILEPILDQDLVDTRTRYEKERLDFILKYVDVRYKSILDIGGNTGFFVFELLDAGAKSGHLYEGNKEHCEFVSLATKAVGFERLKVTNAYYNFKDHEAKYDICLLLNVLHHVGDDYDNQSLELKEAKVKILEQLNSMSLIVDTLVFQLGFNWHGNPKTGIFKNGTKKEMIEYIKVGIAEHWDIEAIGIAEKNGNVITYKELDPHNLERDDSLGEFLNRPLFILKAIK